MFVYSAFLKQSKKHRPYITHSADRQGPVLPLPFIIFHWLFFDARVCRRACFFFVFLWSGGVPSGGGECSGGGGLRAARAAPSGTHYELQEHDICLQGNETPIAS